MPKRCSREDDDLHLEWMHLDARGWSSSQIAARYDVTSERVRVVLNRVKKDYQASVADAVQ